MNQVARKATVGDPRAAGIRESKNEPGGFNKRRDLATTKQTWYMAHGTGQTAVRRMYRRLVPLSRMLHNGVGHGTPFVLSTPLARPLACPSMTLWDAGRCTVGDGGDCLEG